MRNTRKKNKKVYKKESRKSHSRKSHSNKKKTRKNKKGGAPREKRKIKQTQRFVPKQEEPKQKIIQKKAWLQDPPYSYETINDFHKKYGKDGKKSIKSKNKWNEALSKGKHEKAPEASGWGPICHNYLKGHCWRGDKCRYRHCPQERDEYQITHPNWKNLKREKVKSPGLIVKIGDSSSSEPSSSSSSFSVTPYEGEGSEGEKAREAQHMEDKRQQAIVKDMLRKTIKKYGITRNLWQRNRQRWKNKPNRGLTKRRGKKPKQYCQMYGPVSSNSYDTDDLFSKTEESEPEVLDSPIRAEKYSCRDDSADSADEFGRSMNERTGAWN